MLEIFTDSLSSVIFPRRCAICGGEQPSSRFGHACSQCWASTEVFNGSESLCPRCGAVIAFRDGGLVKACRECEGAHYERARACGPYSGALQAEVVGLKQTPHLARSAKLLLTRAIELFGFDSSTLIVPVPLSKRRLIERSFNQAEVIGNVIADHLKVPLDSRSLQRTSHSPIHRVGMDGKARDLSVRNAFAVVRPNLIRDQRVLLVDDVVTSGATVNYCAKALKKSGASEVNVLTLARAVMRS